ncbi:hypothetical protein R1flu_003285 [Riccia fluitans]|uniref:Uncharacterized protein n=1 Tax=Riccia fluitans TaxID=41844 RepID=A0ABD1Y8R1_9MARC
MYLASNVDSCSSLHASRFNFLVVLAPAQSNLRPIECRRLQGTRLPRFASIHCNAKVVPDSRRVDSWLTLSLSRIGYDWIVTTRDSSGCRSVVAEGVTNSLSTVGCHLRAFTS